MKLKNLFEIIGFKKKSKRYGYRISEFMNNKYGTIKYAQWLHPFETDKIIDEKVINVYEKFLQKGDFCIDIGAHSGDSTLPMALCVGTKGLTLALEPNPYVYPTLEKNIRLNKDTCNIYSIMAAATPEDSIMSFEYSDSGYCNGGRHENISVLKHGHAYKLEVQGINLQKELETTFSEETKKLKFIKIDTEGFDLYILESIKDTIEKYRPTIKAEVFKKTDANYRKKYLEFFQKLNYKIFLVNDDELEVEVELNEENLFYRKHYDSICIPNEKSSLVDQLPHV